MDLVYIVEREAEQPYPNFTIPGREDVITSNKKYYQDIANPATVAVAGALGFRALSYFTPAALLIGASVAIPTLYKLLTSDDEKGLISQESVNELQKYIGNHSLSKDQAKERGFIFPPGHPRVGETYKLHPLAGYPQALKDNLYIPECIFDNVLFEERESELLTLLVNLGATEVEIEKYVESYIESEKSADVEIGVDHVAGLSISGNSDTNNISNKKNVRTFSLKGKPWEYGDKLERDDYAWLHFEPSWNALVLAREVGGCTSATLEVKEASKYVSNKESSMKIKAKIYSTNGTLNFMQKELRETSYIFKVKFS